MLIVNNLNKSYGPTIVLNSVSFSLNTGMRVGLVGVNGVGKSTLLKILANLEKADSGRIEAAAFMAVSYLPQNLTISSDQTIEDALTKSAGELSQLRSRMQELEIAIPKAGEQGLQDLLAAYGVVSERYELMGGYELDHRVTVILEGLGIGCLERSRTVETLSGGEKTRLGLAGILLQPSDLLLLDEPTNNLDLRSLNWVESFLGAYKGSMIIASHDRQFLNNVVNVIFEIDEHSHELKKYPGNYDAYKAAKSVERARWAEEYQNQQEEISELKKKIKSNASTIHDSESRKKTRDNDKFARYFMTQSHQQKAVSHNINSAQERLLRIERDPIVKPPKPLRFNTNFSVRSLRSSEVLKAVGLSKSFGSRVILRDLTFKISHNSRIVISGPNGAGKTTLLRILAGIDSPDSGSLSGSPAACIGFLPQEPDDIEPGQTVMEYYSRGLAGHQDDFVFGLVTCGVFRYAEINKQVGQLSLGQVRKLQIARMIAMEPNFLILDEPTNHISLDVLESFEEAIREFEGPVIAVSHDRRFIQQFGGEVWELETGSLRNRGRTQNG